MYVPLNITQHRKKLTAKLLGQLETSADTPFPAMSNCWVHWQFTRITQKMRMLKTMKSFDDDNGFPNNS